jgi:hypothetical protein
VNLLKNQNKVLSVNTTSLCTNVEGGAVGCCVFLLQPGVETPVLTIFLALV